jgi:hypothetical protein
MLALWQGVLRANLPPNRLFDADAQVLRRFAARLLRAGQLRR